MAPKRKRAENTPSESTARITRSSFARTRIGGGAGVVEGTLNSAGAIATSVGEPEILTKDYNENGSPSTLANTAKSTESEPSTAASTGSLFSKYADPDDPSVIGPQGFERICSDMDISLEGVLPLILAWQMGASEMAKLSRSEWENGIEELQISSLQALSVALHDLEDLLLLDKPPLNPAAAPPSQAKKKSAASFQSAPYNRARYYRYAMDPKKAFNELYSFCFVLAKPLQGRNIDMETASALWSVLVAPRFSLMSELLEFINEKGTYKGVNKDLWSMVLEFCRIIQPDLSNYEPDGAWPTMLDDFVAWRTSNTADGVTSGDAMIE